MIDTLKESLRLKGEITFTVRAHPGARKTQWKDVMDDGTFKLDIAAPPEDGKANEALVRFLAEYFDVPRSSVEVLSGQTGRRKVVRIEKCKLKIVN